MSDTSSSMRFLQQENARLHEENQHLKTRVEALQEYLLAVDALEQATHSLSNEKDLMRLLDKTLSYAISVLGASDGSLLVMDEESGDLVFVLVHGKVREVLPGYRIPGNEGIAGWSIQNKQPVIVNNVHNSPNFSERVDQAFDFETRSLMCAPLVTRRKTLGVIEVVNKVSGEDFIDTDLNLLSILALVAAIALEDVARQPEEAKS